MPPPSSEILIIGGGVGGLALALALHRSGIPSLVCERAGELLDVGAGILLTPNASWVLQRLGLLGELQDHGRIARSWKILDHAGRSLQTFSFERENPPPISLARSILQTTLVNHLPPETLLLGREAVSIHAATASSGPEVQFADGEKLSAKLVVGADGGKSVARKNLFDDAPPRSRGYLGWRALAPIVPDAWRNGLISESWGDGSRFGISPVSPDRTYWYATENASAGMESYRRNAKARLLEKFGCWHDPIRSLIEATPEEEILLSDIADHRVPARWHRGNVVLLGDSAHLMTPNLGQGAAMALEAAWVLACCLSEHGIGAPALSRYERQRLWRTRGVVWASRQIGRIIQLEHPLATRLRDFAFRCNPAWIGQKTLSPVFDFRV